MNWRPDQHEYKVERLYGTGAERLENYHDGYLNFGLWTPPVKTYLEAAENLVLTMARKLELNAQSKVIDVASGMGAQDILLVKNVGCHITSVEVTRKHVDQALRRIQAAHMSDRIDARFGTAVSLPFPDESFTHALCVEGTQHFNTRLDFLHEAYRVLKPGGKICVSDYALTSFPKKFWQKHLINLAARLWCVPKVNFGTPATYLKTMQEVGFKNVTIESIGAQSIPGYVQEAQRPDNLKQQRRIRGFFPTLFGKAMDYSVLYAFNAGLIDYLILTAEK